MLRHSRRYVLVVLTATFALSHLDRQILAILLEPIKRDLQLSDTQLGALSGLVFAVFYSVLGIPFALRAVTGSRVNIIALSVTVWSAMTVACGLAQTYLQLVLARIGVAVGEAGSSPSAHAIISDLYPPKERVGAMAVYASGVNFGLFLALLGGGLAVQFLGWRWTFMLAGLPGLAVALVVWLTLRDPDRQVQSQGSSRKRLVRRTIVAMWSDRVIRHLVIGCSLTAVVGYGSVAWLPSFLIRSHQLQPAQVGMFLAWAVGIGGLAGAIAVGKLSDRLAQRDQRWGLWCMTLALLSAKPFLFAFYLVDATQLALVLFLLPAVCSNVFLGPSIAAIHGRMDPSLRPIASAFLLFLMNLVGLGIGPLLAGAVSDGLAEPLGSDSLRAALVVLQLIGLWGIAHFVYSVARVRDGRLAIA